MAEYPDMHKMSMELNSAFDNSLYSEYSRLFKYTIDPINAVLCGFNNKTVGSAAEGTRLSDSDLDVLLIDKKGVRVGYNPQEAGIDANKPYLRLTRGPLTPAGYTNLQVYLNGNNCDNIKNTLLQSFLDFCEMERYNSNTILLTNRKLKDKFYRFNVTVHGPAQTIQMSNDETIDTVVAYESKIIPIDMNSWFERIRPNRWPSKTTCELFKSMGCFYVSVGHSKCPEKDFEWRISPTRQELYLTFNLNPTQFRCYILLKLIKKTIRKHCCDGISSYHCKTALFWTIENTEINIWQPQNLIECVLKCLKLLLFWITEKKCPNYFIPEENMFETKVMNTIQIETFQDLITNYFLIRCQPLLSVIVSSCKEMDAIIEFIIELKKGVLYSINDASSLTEQAFHTIQQYIELIKTKPRNVCIREFQDRVSPHKIDIDILLDILKEKLCCLNRTYHLKSLLESNTFTEKDITADLNDPSKESHIDREYCLKLASIAATRGAYSTCDKLLQHIHRMTRLYIYCRCCVSFKTDEVQFLVQNNISENFRLIKQFKNKLAIRDILQRISVCLQFRDNENEAVMVISPLNFDTHKLVGIPSEMISIPITNIKYDLNEIDLVSIHPTAYLYFLQYKNSEMMNKKDDMCVALDKLEEMNLINLQTWIYPHPDTTLNLLGHIYTTKGWYRLAVQCFRKSWQLLPYYNSVKWHVMFMLFCNLSFPGKNNNMAFKTEINQYRGLRN